MSFTATDFTKDSSVRENTNAEDNSGFGGPEPFLRFILFIILDNLFELQSGHGFGSCD